MKYIAPPNIPAKILEKMIQSSCKENLVLTELDHLIKLIRSLQFKCGESLIALHEKYVEN